MDENTQLALDKFLSKTCKQPDRALQVLEELLAFRVPREDEEVLLPMVLPR